MKIIEIADVESSPNPHGVDARKIYDTRKCSSCSYDNKTW